MQTLGDTRRMDDLGRVVIPKVIREKLNIKEEEALEILVDDENKMVCFKKISTPSLTEQIENFIGTNIMKLPLITVKLLQLAVDTIDEEENENEES